MFVILRVLCLLIIQCSCHWSQLKATYLLTYIETHLKYINTHFPYVVYDH